MTPRREWVKTADGLILIQHTESVQIMLQLQMPPGDPYRPSTLHLPRKVRPHNRSGFTMMPSGAIWMPGRTAWQTITQAGVQ